jgi:hypothetical protein
LRTSLRAFLFSTLRFIMSDFACALCMNFNPISLVETLAPAARGAVEAAALSFISLDPMSKLEYLINVAIP